MAFPASSVNGRFLQDAFNGVTFNLDTNSIRVSLFTDAVTGSDKNASETYNSGPWVTANEIGSYQALANPTLVTPAAGEWVFKDSSDTISWSGITGTVAGLLVYSTTASNRVMATIKLAAPVILSAGDYVHTWTDSAIFKVSY